MGEISKSETRGYCLDLDSMELTHCPYGEEIVNDYILQGDTETIWWFVDWVSFSVVETIGKKILRKIGTNFFRILLLDNTVKTNILYLIYVL